MRSDPLAHRTERTLRRELGVERISRQHYFTFGVIRGSHVQAGHVTVPAQHPFGKTGDGETPGSITVVPESQHLKLYRIVNGNSHSERSADPIVLVLED